MGGGGEVTLEERIQVDTHTHKRCKTMALIH
jgi:hypothetical protein